MIDEMGTDYRVDVTFEGALEKVEDFDTLTEAQEWALNEAEDLYDKYPSGDWSVDIYDQRPYPPELVDSMRAPDDARTEAFREALSVLEHARYEAFNGDEVVKAMQRFLRRQIGKPPADFKFEMGGVLKKGKVQSALTDIPGARPQYDENGNVIVLIAICNTCGRAWNDALISDITPTRAGRCPFEYEH